MKRLWIAAFLLLGNEIVTYIILTAFLIMFFSAVIKQMEGKRNEN
jgi:hypothetical protein